MPSLERLGLGDACLLKCEVARDERGAFHRTYDAAFLRDAGVTLPAEQSNVAYNRLRHTLRGLHYQTKPSEEAKLVTCVRGSVFDVIVDVREDSSTRFQWRALRLTALSGDSLYVPEGFAHGYLTLTAHATLHYQISVPFDPKAMAGLRWDDPALDIRWPSPPALVSERDLAYALIAGK
jgi:dTDP-4-dehydrorhamnose 3,5-epimerase